MAHKTFRRFPPTGEGPGHDGAVSGTPPRSTQGLSPALLALVFAVGLGARLAFLSLGFPPLVSDSYSYWEPGINLAEGRGYLQGGKPTALRPPTYPLFLATLVLVGGPEAGRAVLLQCLVVSLLAPWLTWWLYHHGHSRRAALSAGLLVALDPFLVSASGLILTEALGAVLLAATIAAFHFATLRPAWGRWAFAGLIAGLLGLNTPNTLALLPFLFLWTASWHRLSWRLVACWGLAGLLLASCVATWSVRNRLVLGQIIPVRSIGFTSLIWATTEYESDWLPDPSTPEFQRFLKRFEQIMNGRAAHEVEGAFLRAALQNVRDHPVRILGRVAKANFWFWVETPGAIQMIAGRRIVRWTLFAFHQIQLIAFVAGVIAAVRWGRSPATALALACVAYFVLSLAVMFPVPRYYIPVLPMVDVVAATGVIGWWERRRRPGVVASEGLC